MTSDAKWPNNLAELMRRKGATQADLARHLQTHRQNVSRWVKEQRKIPLAEAESIAAFLGVSPADLFFEDAGPASVPLLSMISASHLLTIDHAPDINEAPRTPAPGLDPRGEWIAFRVDGDSMDRISPPGSIIFVNTRDKLLVPNACYIIIDAADGGATYKRYRPSPDRFEPVSTNPDHQPIFPAPGNTPRVLGRVHKSLIDLA